MYELIHIKRKDYLYALLQRFLCSLLFIQPLVWWLGSIGDREREHLCDEQVVRNNEAHLYARALVKLQQKTKPALSLGLNAVESNVANRIRQLTLCEQGYENNILKLIAIISFILVLAGMAWSLYHLHYIH